MDETLQPASSGPRSSCDIVVCSQDSGEEDESSSNERFGQKTASKSLNKPANSKNKSPLAELTTSEESDEQQSNQSEPVASKQQIARNVPKDVGKENQRDFIVGEDERNSGTNQKDGKQGEKCNLLQEPPNDKDEQRCFECKLSLTNSTHLINIDGGSHKWHPECFKCKVCSHQMDRDLSCHIYKDQLLCRADYKRLKRDQSTTKCARCQWTISAFDWVRRANNFVYHLACFSCDICSRQLNTGEQFAIDVFGSNGPVRLLCRLHFAIDQTHRANHSAVATFRKDSSANEGLLYHSQHPTTSDASTSSPATSDEVRKPDALLNNRPEESSNKRRRDEVSDYMNLLGSPAAGAHNRHYSPAVDAIQERKQQQSRHQSRASADAGHSQSVHQHRHSHHHHNHHSHHHNEMSPSADLAARLYERRGLHRSMPVAPLTDSSLGSLSSGEQLNSSSLNHQQPIVARESGGDSALTNMETNCDLIGAPQSDQCDGSGLAGSINNPTYSSIEMNNIGNSNCSTISNGSNTSSINGTGSNSAGGPMSSSGGNKSKRVRTTFTEDQLAILQTHFQIDSNPDGQDLERIATITGLSKRVTQVWFQNSRARQKKYMTKRKPNSLLTAGMQTTPNPSSMLHVSPAGEQSQHIINDDQAGSLTAMTNIVCNTVEHNDEVG